MALYTEWDAIFNAVTAGLLALFGVWVWTLKPRSRSSHLLALFAVTHGVHYVIENLWNVNYFSLGPESRAPLAVGLVMFTVSSAALFGVAHEVLRSHATPSRTAWRFICAAVFSGAFVAVILSYGSSGARMADLSPDMFLFLAYFYAICVFFFIFGALPLVFAWLYRGRAAAVPQQARILIRLSVAFVLWPALVGSGGLGTLLLAPQQGLVVVDWPSLLVFFPVLATGVLWLLNIRVHAPHARSARNAALITFGILTFGAFDAVVLADVLRYSISQGPFFGLARLATVVILGHAILHHQVLGMDVKLRFAISKSTLAAVFIAVFFVASEGAQLLFGQQNEIVGLAAAGGLVFVLAPLQRAADRLAAKAVPVSAPAAAILHPGADRVRQEELYRQALRIALVDRRVTRDEELHLFQLAEELGIGAGRAMELRNEVEASGGR